MSGLPEFKLPEQATFVLLLKSLPIKYELVQEENNTWSCWTTEGIETYGIGDTQLECQLDLVSGMKDMAEIYYTDERFHDTLSRNPVLLLHVMKCLVSSKEELITCLVGLN